MAPSRPTLLSHLLCIRRGDHDDETTESPKIRPRRRNRDTSPSSTSNLVPEAETSTAPADEGARPNNNQGTQAANGSATRIIQRLGYPPPLPKVRAKRLTPPPLPASSAASTSSTEDATYDSQSRSLFFSILPKEVRLLIYELAMGGGRVVHVEVLFAKARLAHCICMGDWDLKQRRRLPLWQHMCWAHWWETGSPGWETSRFHGPLGSPLSELERGSRRSERRPWLGSLLRVSRRVYSEAIEILYARNIFHLGSPTIFNCFITNILPHRLQQIRYLAISSTFLVAAYHQQPQPPQQQHPHQPDSTGAAASASEEEGDYIVTTVFSPTEKLAKWPQTCTALASMSGLRSLIMEVSLWDEYPSPDFRPDEVSLARLLRPLMGIRHVPDFRVLLTCPVPAGLLERLEGGAIGGGGSSAGVAKVPFVIEDLGVDYTATDTSAF